MHVASRTGHRVLVIDDHPLFAEALEMSLGRAGHLAETLVFPSRGTTLAGLRSRALRRAPHSVVLDLDLGRLGDSSSLIAPFVRARIAVVALLGDDDPARAGDCLHLGATRVLSKAGALAEVLDTVSAIHRGAPAIPATELAPPIDSSPAASHRRRLQRLSPREREVLAALVDGQTVPEIARAAVVSTATVRTQVKSILAKLEVSSQLAAVAVANRLDWHLAR